MGYLAPFGIQVHSGGERQPEYKMMLRYIINARPIWASGDPVISKANHNKAKKIYNAGPW